MDLSKKINIVGITNVGKMRKQNEDAIQQDSTIGLAILADGMGGHLGGEVASQMTVDSILEIVQENINKQIDNDTEFSDESICVKEAIEYANHLVFSTQEAQPEYKGMGTTIVTLLFYNNQVTIAHIGDSRCYLYRNKMLEQVTKDHSLLQELIDRGFYTPEEAKKSSNKNLVTRALGIDPSATPDIQEDIVLKGDLFLLCSDGLTDLVEDEFISLTLERFSDNLEVAAKQLISKANDNGGKDNISVMLCYIEEDYSIKTSWFKKLVNWFD
ncbi:MAG: Stp1/IreP family PP2C-type Ser/Thr phosphatase [Gammaproteobacteria bacterium]|nr:Stp1/IreP family PP2C-type Ser/Thr phosphatase [Gammaproteobacteria bacterium]